MNRSSICFFAACLMASCSDLPKTATPEAAPPPPVKKTEEPVAPVMPVENREDGRGMKTPDDTARLPTGQDFTPSADPRNNSGATIHVTPPSDPKPDSTDAKPVNTKPE